MPTWTKHLDDILIVAVFVVVPVLQRVFAHLAKQRSAAAQSERARRALETPPDAEPAESEARGRERWRELLSRPMEPEPAMEEEVQPEPEPEPELETAAAAPAPSPPAKRARPATLIPFEPSALGGMSPAPSEDELEGAIGAGRSPLVALETLDVHEAVEPLATLPGLVAGQATPSGSAPALAGATAWRRAVVLSEILQPPVALRRAGDLAPGLGEVA